MVILKNVNCWYYVTKCIIIWKSWITPWRAFSKCPIYHVTTSSRNKIITTAQDRPKDQSWRIHRYGFRFYNTNNFEEAATYYVLAYNQRRMDTIVWKAINVLFPTTYWGDGRFSSHTLTKITYSKKGNAEENARIHCHLQSQTLKTFISVKI